LDFDVELAGMATAPKSFDTSLPTGLDVDAFLEWAKGRPGRYELHNGEIFAMSPARNRHSSKKGSIYSALRDAVRQAGVPCHVMPDGVAVYGSDSTWYEPDGLVYCGPEAPGDDIKIDNPMIIVEVHSPSTGTLDASDKLIGYFGVESVEHYLIVHSADRRLIHHKRQGEGTIQTRIVTAGPLHLDPPGLIVDLSEVLS
jgi:Uma2 family endonuclease